MDSGVSTWISLLAAVTAFLAYLEAKKSKRGDRSLDALRKVVEAADKTETYMRQRADGARKNRKKEYELAELWSEAAFLITTVDRDLAFRLHEKSRFWRNPRTWQPSRTQGVDISLRSVRKDAERLLKKVA